jgi:hypothetical protein
MRIWDNFSRASASLASKFLGLWDLFDDGLRHILGFPGLRMAYKNRLPNGPDNFLIFFNKIFKGFLRLLAPFLIELEEPTTTGFSLQDAD